MSQPPAVVIIARHGTRFDAANPEWHHSTPTPYDPPLTYSGWNHCRALGVRIASLLHAREQAYNNAPLEAENGTMYRRRRKKHKVVMHTSPFLRCLQTSVAIAAGMAQFEAPKEPVSKTAHSRPRTPGSLHSASPRLRALDGGASPNLAAIAEPKHDFAHNIARKMLEHKRHRKAKIRVDALLGEWLNPQYFEDITPPPPSAMMVAAAKAEMMHQENVDLFVPTVTNKSSASSLWSGASSRANSFNDTRDTALGDWSDMADALPGAAPGRRDRTSSMSSVGSNDSSSGRKSPFRSGSGLQPLTSTIPKPEASVYHPPTPSYAVSGSDYIPRGYVAHARNACTTVDFQWDSSRAPLEWGDGGVFGEEYSSMQRRFRRGLNNMMYWYSQHGADDRAEDALGFDQAERHHYDDDEQEDLVVIMVTHGTGCNALIGGLTGQPVLMDIGMSSLTMAVRREHALPLNVHGMFNGSFANGTSSPWSSPDLFGLNGHRKSIVPIDIGLSTMYEMKLVSSMEHTRPGVDPTKCSGTLIPSDSKYAKPERPKRPVSGVDILPNYGDSVRNNTSASLGSIRRPSLSNVGSVASAPVTRVTSPGPSNLSVHTSSIGDHLALPPPAFSTGLWTPPASRVTPQLIAQNVKEEKDALFSKLNGETPHGSPGRDLVLDFSNATADARPVSPQKFEFSVQDRDFASDPKKHDSMLSDSGADSVGNYTRASEDSNREYRQNGLWAMPAGDKVTRVMLKEPKRRWTLSDEQ